MKPHSTTRTVVSTRVELDEQETRGLVDEVQTLVAEGKLADDSALWVLYNRIKTHEERFLRGVTQRLGEGEWHPDA